MVDKEAERKCSCKGWKENIGQLNAHIAFALNHCQSGWFGRQFKYCPWCGKKLREAKG